MSLRILIQTKREIKMMIKNLTDWLYIQYAWVTSSNNVATFIKRFYYSYDTFYNVCSHSLSKAIYKDAKQTRTDATFKQV